MGGVGVGWEKNDRNDEMVTLVGILFHNKMAVYKEQPAKQMDLS